MFGSVFTLRSDNYTIEGVISAESDVEMLAFADDVTTTASKAACPATPDDTLNTCVAPTVVVHLMNAVPACGADLRLPRMCTVAAVTCRCCGAKSEAL